ncbi:Nuclear fusion protein BIK1 [Nakaseomyces bracarensis]|uniref:Nuclear fusion protein BIK1 n=1 Tax=Nakaseomyces bracarensis TaxID=273131 RepID=A0ABR4NYK9_9SACH
MNEYGDKVGCYIQIPNLGRGKLKYIGPVDGKPGTFAGVDLLANIGKNDGSFQGKRYFEAEYPQSGLFIQVARIAHLLEAATNERSVKKKSYGNLVTSTTTDMDDEDIMMLDSISRTQSARRTSSNGTTVVSRETAASSGVLTEPYSPTPMRSFRIASRTQVDQPSSVPLPGVATTPEAIQNQRLAEQTSGAGGNEAMIREYELQLEKQQREILQYKKLLDDQRIVLEEIQPTIDEFERNERKLTAMVTNLEEELRTQREKSERQKQFYEAEHEQLLTVVNQLQIAIEENEKRVIARNNNNENSEPTKNVDDSELTSLQAEFEKAKQKWDKERQQLKMHNETLSQEYQSLNKEILDLQQKLDAQSQSQEGTTKPTQESQSQESQDTNLPTNVSLPVYKPSQKVDPAAGRDLWCYLCEKPGHRTSDCPHEPDTKFF